MTDIQEKGIIFFIGAMGYGIIEIACRGYTHWSMLLTGGWCFLVLYMIHVRYPDLSLLKKCLVGCAIITTTEFFVGCIVNIWLGWNVWDYSAYRINLWGQICLPLSITWFFLCLPIFALSSILRRATLIRRFSNTRIHN